MELPFVAVKLVKVVTPVTKQNTKYSCAGKVVIDVLTKLIAVGVG